MASETIVSATETVGETIVSDAETTASETIVSDAEIAVLVSETTVFLTFVPVNVALRQKWELEPSEAARMVLLV